VRILMLDNEFPPLGGGTGVVNFHLLQELATYHEVSVDLVTSSRSRRNFERERFSERITIYKVPVDNRNIHHSTNRELLLYSWRGLRQSRKLLKQHHYDLSFAFAGVPAGGISYTLKVMAGLPYLVSLQGPDVPGFEARYNYLYPLLKPLLYLIWGNADVVTAISQEHQHLAHRTMPNLEIPIIYNGVDTTVFHSNNEHRQRTAINILCVGRLIERKGQHHLLQAFATLQNRSNHALKLTLVGTGDAEDSLRRLAVSLSVADAVCFAGFVPREDMPELFRQADIFVLPSQNEGMSIALLEAMASGLPVVVTDTGGTQELIKGNGFIVPWGEPGALAEVLSRMIDCADLRESLGAMSREIAAQFDWKSITEKYLEICDNIRSSRGHTQNINGEGTS
jgi:phosphatidyl-myo-inositol dimannoside synthase